MRCQLRVNAHGLLVSGYSLVLVITVQSDCWLTTMATSTSSYRRSTTLRSAGNRGHGDASLQSKLEQARQQRTAFYRRLARVQTDDDRNEVEVETETSNRRRRQRLDLDASSPHCEVVSSVSSTQSHLLEPVPEPRSRQVIVTGHSPS